LPVGLDVVAGWFRLQAHGCAELGSPFYAELLERVADDIESDGPAAAVVAPFRGETGWSALALRLMGSVHRLVLTGEAPALAARYPSASGDGDAIRAWPVFRSLLGARREDITRLMRGGCQTNEVRRCAALLVGFLEAARRTRLSLRILEIGASAGLNLRWDRYRYEAATGSWGDPLSPVRFSESFEKAPAFDVAARVADRRGCDLNPIDPTSPDGLLGLRSFLWADQLDRFQLLDGAVEVARRVPAVVERMDAVAFLERELATARTDVATVVYHSVVLQYLDDASRAAIDRLIEGSGVMRLSMEPGEEMFEIRLDGDLLALTKAHGTGVSALVS
jgi:hypothetical protein